MTQKQLKRFLRQGNGMVWHGHVSEPTEHAVHFLKTEGRKTPQQAAAQGTCSKGLAKQHKQEDPAFGDVWGFQTSDCH